MSQIHRPLVFYVRQTGRRGTARSTSKLLSKLAENIDGGYSSENDEPLLRLSLTQNLSDLFSNLVEQRTVSETPFAFYISYLSQVPAAEIFEQHDAGEFFHILLARISSELSQVKRNDISSIFEGSLIAMYECENCKKTTEDCSTSFTEFQLEIPRNKIYTEYFNNKLTGKGLWRIVAPDIEDCIDFSLRTETVRRNCKCLGEQTSHIRRTIFQTLPNTLVFNVNRVIFNSRDHRSKKDFCEIGISAKIDMSSFLTTAGPFVYNLTGVVVHHGKSTGAGHFSVYSKRESGWFYLNDTDFRDLSSKSTEQVAQLIESESSTSNTNPAILFYQREMQNASYDGLASESSHSQLYEKLLPGQVDAKRFRLI